VPVQCNPFDVCSADAFVWLAKLDGGLQVLRTLRPRAARAKKKELSLTLSGAALSQAIIAKALYLSCMPVRLSGCSTLPMMSHLRDLDLIYYPS
jgi:hypothetical protein